MFEPRENETAFLHGLRLVARAAAVVCLALIILFVFGEGFDIRNMTATEMIGMLFFPIGVFVGLVMGWREEGIGGWIVVGSIAAFYVIYGWLLNGTMRQGWTFLLFLIPGILFLVYRYSPHATPHSGRVEVSS